MSSSSTSSAASLLVTMCSMKTLVYKMFAIVESYIFFLFCISLTADGPQRTRLPNYLTYCNVAILLMPVITKYLPISPRGSPCDFLSRCKLSTLTTRPPMVEFYFLTFSRLPH